MDVSLGLGKVRLGQCGGCGLEIRFWARDGARLTCVGCELEHEIKCDQMLNLTTGKRTQVWCCSCRWKKTQTEKCEPELKRTPEKHSKGTNPIQTFDNLCQLLRERGLERLIPRANELVAPSIRLLLEPWPPSNAANAAFNRLSGFYPNDETPVRCSKVGGLPDLPPGFVWPESQTCALPFLAQLRLEEVSSHDLDGNQPRLTDCLL